MPAERIRKKLIVVGDGAVGKTNLIMGFAKGEWPEVYTPTVFETTVTDIGEFSCCPRRCLVLMPSMQICESSPASITCLSSRLDYTGAFAPSFDSRLDCTGHVQTES